MASRKEVLRKAQVYPTYQDRQKQKSCVVPELHLLGRWLERAGFEVGDEVEVKVSRRCLVITKVKAK